MINERVRILIGRHGAKIVSPDKVLKEQISPESLARLHAEGGSISEGYRSPERLSLFVSQRPRTEATGKARFAGMLGLKVPESQPEILDDNNYPTLAPISVNRRFGLGFYNGEMNDEVYLAAEKQKPGLGGEVCTEFGLKNLSATEHLGKKIIPFGYVVAKAGQVLREAIDLAHPKRNDLIQLVSHSVVADAGVAALVSSGFGSDKILTNCNDYGGSFAEEDFGVLELDFKQYENGKGLNNQAKFVRAGKSFSVNLDNFNLIIARLNLRHPTTLFPLFHKK